MAGLNTRPGGGRRGRGGGKGIDVLGGEGWGLLVVVKCDSPPTLHPDLGPLVDTE